MTKTVEIIRCTEPTELCRRYDGQSTSQCAYIELDLRDGTLLASYDSETGNAVPFSVWHGFERRYGIPVLTGEAANRVMEAIEPLAARMLADWRKVWDGNNMVARLGRQAQAAEAEIEALVVSEAQASGARSCGLELEPDEEALYDDSDVVDEWDVDIATNGCEEEEYGITAETSDERLAEIAAEITKELAEESRSSVVVVHGLTKYLRGLRNDLAEEAT